jgi:hypothetical protein
LRPRESITADAADRARRGRRKDQRFLVDPSPKYAICRPNARQERKQRFA